jgi:ABC-type branched-subunit amino acid transport system ATPase component
MTRPPALDAQNVSVHFGGLWALQDVSIRVEDGETVGLVGGNGAGKTTFMDCVSGYVRCEAGASISVFGSDLVGLPPEMRAYVHVGRSYQHARLFGGLTTEEALLVAVERRRPAGVMAAVLGLRSARQAERHKRELVDRLVDSTGLGSYREKLISELSTGTRRVVDIASILAQEPKLLLLDEPTTGLAQREAEAFPPLIERVKADLGCSVLIVEHDVVLISELCDRVYALQSGRVIAQGDPKTVRRDPLFVASYLGTDDAAIFRSGVFRAADGKRKPSRTRRGAAPARAARTSASTRGPR